MWLALPVVALLIAGVVLTIVGAAPAGVPMIIVGLVVLGLQQRRRDATTAPPEPVAGGFKDTGYAHEGQEHMVPGQQPPGA